MPARGRRLFLVGALTALLPSVAAAQRPARGDTATRICDMRYKLLMLTVLDRAGRPVPGVSVTLSGIAASSEGRPARITSETGEVQLAEDLDMRFVKPTGSKVTVTLRKGRTVRRVAMTLGHDPGGCHIALLRGETTIRF